MASGVIATVEEHPYITAGVVFIVGVVIIYYYFSPSSGGAVDNSGYYGAQAAAITSGNALQAAQIQGQVSVAGFQADVNREALDTAAAIAIASTTAHTTELQATLAEQLGQRTAVSTDLQNTLLSQIAIHTSDNAVTTLDYGAAQQTEQQRILAATLVTNHAADIGLAEANSARDYALHVGEIASAERIAATASTIEVGRIASGERIAAANLVAATDLTREAIAGAPRLEAIRALERTYDVGVAAQLANPAGGLTLNSSNLAQLYIAANGPASGVGH